MPPPKYKLNPYVGIHPEPSASVFHAAVVDLQFWTWDNIIAPFWRLYWNDRSGAYVEMDGIRWELDPDHIVIVPPHIKVASHTSRRLKHFFIDFYLPKTGFLAPREPLLKPVTRWERECIDSFVRGIAVKEPGDQPMLSHFARMLVESSLPSINARSEKIPERDPRIDRAVQLIHLQPMNKCPVTELAKSVGMSTGGFARLFLKSAGLTPKQYQLSHWVEESCQLLLNPRLKIEEIADRCGFYDRFHYTKAFQSLMKSSPAAFRKRYRVVLDPE